MEEIAEDAIPVIMLMSVFYAVYGLQQMFGSGC